MTAYFCSKIILIRPLQCQPTFKSSPIVDTVRERTGRHLRVALFANSLVHKCPRSTTSCKAQRRAHSSLKLVAHINLHRWLREWLDIAVLLIRINAFCIITPHMRNIAVRFVSRVLSYVEAKKKSVKSHLLRLPPELILMIAELLSTTPAACLTLCSRQLSSILGPDSWESLKTQTLDVRLEFLWASEKDLPEHFVCQECVCLHRIGVTRWH